MDHTAVFMHYARTWLALDLAASIPVDWFMGGIDFVEPQSLNSSSCESYPTLLLARARGSLDMISWPLVICIVFGPPPPRPLTRALSCVRVWEVCKHARAPWQRHE